MSDTRHHFLLMDGAKNVVLIPSNDAAEILRRVDLKAEVKQHETKKALFETISNYLKGVWTENDDHD